jgi:hypothetical protein
MQGLWKNERKHFLKDKRGFITTWKGKETLKKCGKHHEDEYISTEEIKEPGAYYRDVYVIRVGGTSYGWYGTKHEAYLKYNNNGGIWYDANTHSFVANKREKVYCRYTDEVEVERFLETRVYKVDEPKHYCNFWEHYCGISGNETFYGRVIPHKYWKRWFYGSDRKWVQKMLQAQNRMSVKTYISNKDWDAVEPLDKKKTVNWIVI